MPSHAVDLEDHVIVAGYGQAARYLVRVLSGSNIPFIITTLSPEGANEAESENMTVVRGDYSKQFLLDAVGISRAKMLVIADDNVSMAHRTTSVARQLNPTMRIVVRTRYISDAEHLTEAGADVVIAEELESIVQLFGEVLRDYRIPAEEIDNYEELARQNGYSALLNAGQSAADESVFACQPGEDCFDTRTIIVRRSTPFANKPLSALNVFENDGLHLQTVNRNARAVEDLTQDFIIKPGDELIFSGSTDAFVRNADLFRAPAQSNRQTAEIVSIDEKVLPEEASAKGKSGEKKFIDTEKAVEFKPKTDESVCVHLKQIRRVFPSADGCEDCLRIGDSWVHLRICLSCGHTGCCDSSKNKHAAAHFQECVHPIIKSLEPGEDWAWCYQDKTYL
jgi:CPA2 family monovalent cation:H+ antiporter-2